MSDQIQFFVNNIKFMLVIVNFLFNEETKKASQKKQQVFSGEVDSATAQTNILIAIQSKIYEPKYRRTEGFKKEHFVLSFIKSSLRVVLKHMREAEFQLEEGRQVLIDCSFICELFNELVDREDENVVSGFYHSILNAIKANTPDGDPSLKPDKMLQIYQKKRSSFKMYN